MLYYPLQDENPKLLVFLPLQIGLQLFTLQFVFLALTDEREDKLLKSLQGSRVFRGGDGLVKISQLLSEAEEEEENKKNVQKALKHHCDSILVEMKEGC